MTEFMMNKYIVQFNGFAEGSVTAGEAPNVEEIVFLSNLNVFAAVYLPLDPNPTPVYYVEWDGSDDFYDGNNDIRQDILFKNTVNNEHYHWTGTALKLAGGIVAVDNNTLSQSDGVARIADNPKTSGNSVGDILVTGSSLPTPLQEKTRYNIYNNITTGTTTIDNTEVIQLPAGSKIVPKGGMPLVLVTGGEMSWVHSSDIGMIQDDLAMSNTDRRAISAANKAVLEVLVRTRYNLILDGTYLIQTSGSSDEAVVNADRIVLDRQLYIQGGAIRTRSGLFKCVSGGGVVFDGVNIINDTIDMDGVGNQLAGQSAVQRGVVLVAQNGGLLGDVVFRNCKLVGKMTAASLLDVSPTGTDIPLKASLSGTLKDIDDNVYTGVDVTDNKKYFEYPMLHCKILTGSSYLQIPDTILMENVKLKSDGSSICDIENVNSSLDVSDGRYNNCLVKCLNGEMGVYYPDSNGEYVFKISESVTVQNKYSGKYGFWRIYQPSMGSSVQRFRAVIYTKEGEVDKQGISNFEVTNCLGYKAWFDISDIVVYNSFRLCNNTFNRCNAEFLHIGSNNTMQTSGEWMTRCCPLYIENNRFLKIPYYWGTTHSGGSYCCAILAEVAKIYLRNNIIEGFSHNERSNYEAYLSAAEVHVEGNTVLNCMALPELYDTASSTRWTEGNSYKVNDKVRYQVNGTWKAYNCIVQDNSSNIIPPSSNKWEETSLVNSLKLQRKETQGWMKAKSFPISISDLQYYKETMGLRQKKATIRHYENNRYEITKIMLEKFRVEDISESDAGSYRDFLIGRAVEFGSTLYVYTLIWAGSDDVIVTGYNIINNTSYGTMDDVLLGIYNDEQGFALTDVSSIPIEDITRLKNWISFEYILYKACCIDIMELTTDRPLLQALYKNNVFKTFGQFGGKGLSEGSYKYLDFEFTGNDITAWCFPRGSNTALCPVSTTDNYYNVLYPSFTITNNVFRAKKKHRFNLLFFKNSWSYRINRLIVKDNKCYNCGILVRPDLQNNLAPNLVANEIDITANEEDGFDFDRDMINSDYVGDNNVLKSFYYAVKAEIVNIEITDNSTIAATSNLLLPMGKGGSVVIKSKKIIRPYPELESYGDWGVGLAFVNYGYLMTDINDNRYNGNFSRLLTIEYTKDGVRKLAKAEFTLYGTVTSVFATLMFRSPDGTRHALRATGNLGNWDGSELTPFYISDLGLYIVPTLYGTTPNSTLTSKILLHTDADGTHNDVGTDIVITMKEMPRKDYVYIKTNSPLYVWHGGDNAPNTTLFEEFVPKGTVMTAAQRTALATYADSTIYTSGGTTTVLGTHPTLSTKDAGYWVIDSVTYQIFVWNGSTWITSGGI